MKICLVSPWEEICGISEYAKDLVKALPEVEWDLVGRPFNVSDASRSDASIVHLNYEPGLQGHWTVRDVLGIMNTGKKVMMTNHISNEGLNMNGFNRVFDKVVVHEYTPDNDPRFVVIPHGIPEWSGEVEEIEAVGTSGFPFEWKCMPFLAEACNRLGIKFRAVIPESRHCNAIAARDYMQGICPNSEIRTDWASKEEIIPWLAQCKIVAYAHKGGNNGISGSVRMGIAAKKPTVISNCRMFRDILESYKDEFYVVDSWAPTVDQIEHVLKLVLADGKEARRPKRILEDQGWRASALKYLEVYKSL